MTTNHKILLLLASALCAVVVASCSKHNSPEPDDANDIGMPTMGISIALEGVTRTGSSNYEAGVGVENYLDFSNENYRIYLFTDDGIYFDRFEPFIKPNYGDISGNTLYYNFVGAVPIDLPLQFKIVFLANWDTYPETYDDDGFSLVKGETTIDDLCKNVNAQFSYLPAPQSSEDWFSVGGRLIPFYGVHEYDLGNGAHVSQEYIVDGKIKGNIFIDLKNDLAGNDTSVGLLRAYAKVEVKASEKETGKLEYVKLIRYNTKGYCAPLNIYLSSDYVKEDYVTTPSVPLAADGNKEESEQYVSFVQTDDKFIAYMPEYLNLGRSDDEKSRMVVKFVDDDHDYYLYFCDYSSTQRPAYNVLRNYWYKYSVYRENKGLNAVLDVTPYTSVELEPDFGINRDENGNIIDKDGNVISIDGEGNQIFRNPDGLIFLIRNKDKENIIAKLEDGTVVITKDNVKLLEDSDAEIIVRNIENKFKDKSGNEITADENVLVVVKASNGTLYKLDQNGNTL